MAGVLNAFPAATHLKNDAHTPDTLSWEYQHFNYVKINKRKLPIPITNNCHTHSLCMNYYQYKLNMYCERISSVADTSLA
jgi:hypothetical protein